ncbi:12620_t:CDS:2 [Cetraspora pellucida]|uniref:12620_t:CDS:1 n=1 Tax=Cetraspora pellucida TaxID=1433469 RepID=A0A9N9ETP6_9GLOM|nr:12620_t:CDS:2 [Cetraspora pellucida]
MIHALNEALSKLWNVPESEVPNLLNIEKNLCMVDELLKPFLEQNEESFGGTYINVKRNIIIIMIVDETKKDIILNSPDIQTHRELLIFELVQNSLSSLKNTSTQIVANSRQHRPIDGFMYIDIEENDVILFMPLNIDERNRSSIVERNKPFIDSIIQYNPVIRFYEVLVEGQPSRKRPRNSTDTKRDIGRQIINGDAIYNIGKNSRCTAGFWVIDEKQNNYIVTAGHCINFNNTNPIHNIFCVKPLNSSESDGLSFKQEDAIGPMIFHDLGYSLHLNYVTDDLIVTTFIGAKGDSGGPAFYLRDLPYVSLHGIIIAGGKSGEWGHLTFIVKTDYIIGAADRTIELGGS